MREAKRIRDWMDIPGQRLMPGPRNAITDVPGVRVGHTTLHTGAVHTGVTVIVPHAGNVFLQRCPAAVAVGNGFGKLAGALQVRELGEIESLIGLTNTLSVGAVMQGLIRHHLPDMPPDRSSINVLVGETNDSGLSDIRGLHITPGHVEQAIHNASERVEEGAVGAGAGTQALGYKGGIGTASRAVGEYAVGALVQSNYGGQLTVYGHRLDKREGQPDKNGSCMIVLATDAPLDARQLHRLAKRGMIGMTNTGTVMAHGSGDFCIAFSNHAANLRDPRARGVQSMALLPEEELNPYFTAAAEAVQEALYNALTMAVTVTGKDGRTAHALDLAQYADVLALKIQPKSAETGIGGDTLRLCPTAEEDLPFVLSQEQAAQNAEYVGSWSIARHRSAANDPDARHFVMRGAQGAPVGYAILRGLRNPDREIELVRIVVADKGKGYGLQALRLIQRLCFERLGAHRLWLDVVGHNLVAQHVYQQAGFVCEGVLRECRKYPHGYESLHILSMLKSEYRAQSQQN